MSSPVQSISLYTPSPVPQPRIALALEAFLDWAQAALAARRERLASQAARQQFERDMAAARREAASWMRDDPRMGADLLAAIDRQEAAFLPEGRIAR